MGLPEQLARSDRGQLIFIYGITFCFDQVYRYHVIACVRIALMCGPMLKKP